MVLLVELRRLSACDRYVLRRRFNQIVRQSCPAVGYRIPIELRPTGIVVGSHINHQLTWRDRAETVVSESARELPGQSRMLVHLDGQPSLP